MAKRKIRLAWWLAGVLAAVLLGGVGVLVASYQRRLPETSWVISRTPVSLWRFSHGRVDWNAPMAGPISDVYVCGFFEIWVTHP